MMILNFFVSQIFYVLLVLLELAASTRCFNSLASTRLLQLMSIQTIWKIDFLATKTDQYKRDCCTATAVDKLWKQMLICKHMVICKQILRI